MINTTNTIKLINNNIALVIEDGYCSVVVRGGGIERTSQFLLSTPCGVRIKETLNLLKQFKRLVKQKEFPCFFCVPHHGDGYYNQRIDFLLSIGFRWDDEFEYMYIDGYLSGDERDTYCYTYLTSDE